MKNTFTHKLLAAAAALLIVASLTACGSQDAVDASNDVPADVTSSADVSDSDASASDVVVSGGDVSGSDVVVVDDATAADSVFNAYFAAFNSGDAEKLAEVIGAPPMLAFLENAGVGSDYLLTSCRNTLSAMEGVTIVYEYTVAEADEGQLAAIAADLNALSSGAGDKVQAARVYNVNMTAYADIQSVSGSDVSASDAVSGSDAAGNALEQSSGVIRLYKYDGAWYVLGE